MQSRRMQNRHPQPTRNVVQTNASKSFRKSIRIFRYAFGQSSQHVPNVPLKLGFLSKDSRINRLISTLCVELRLSKTSFVLPNTSPIDLRSTATGVRRFPQLPYRDFTSAFKTFCCRPPHSISKSLTRTGHCGRNIVVTLNLLYHAAFSCIDVGIIHLRTIVHAMSFFLSWCLFCRCATFVGCCR